MAFLDNSGDILLDAVLTDSGRQRMAKGNYQITKFALGDDEIDYSTFNTAHGSGSAYYDLEILQTPVLEAFTNNTSFLKSKLVTYSRDDLLYLPILEINNLMTDSKLHSSLTNYCIAVDKDTRDSFSTVQGFLDGFETNSSDTTIRLDQGLDTTAIDPSEGPLIGEERETQYIVEIDNRLGQIVNISGLVASPAFIDDDNLASYYFTAAANPGFVSDITETEAATLTEVISGPRGTRLQVRIRSSLSLRRSNFLFNEIGSTGTLTDSTGASKSIYFIDTILKVTGGTTGYRIDVPVRFVKNQ